MHAIATTTICTQYVNLQTARLRQLAARAAMRERDVIVAFLLHAEPTCSALRALIRLVRSVHAVPSTVAEIAILSR